MILGTISNDVQHHILL